MDTKRIMILYYLENIDGLQKIMTERQAKNEGKQFENRAFKKSSGDRY